MFAMTISAAEPHHSRLPRETSFKKFLTIYIGCCGVGTYAYLYGRSEPGADQATLITLALGYTGAGFSMAAASYVASLIWAETGLFQDKTLHTQKEKTRSSFVR
jgi:hypothetical protein